jgi:hypothetical protein
MEMIRNNRIDAMHLYLCRDGVSYRLWRLPLKHGFSRYLTPLTTNISDGSLIPDYLKCFNDTESLTIARKRRFINKPGS